MIRFEHLTLGYGRRTLLDDVSASIPAGALTALVGRNGTGKSTLLRALAGLGERQRGRILLAGKEIDGLTPRRRAECVALVTTERVRIPDLRCRDVVGLGRAPYTDWTGRLRRSEERRVGTECRL